MRFVRSIDLNRSPAEVWAALIDPSFLPRWHPTLRKLEPVSGAPGQLGAMARLHYREGSRDVVLTETVTASRPPREFATAYRSSTVDSTLRNVLIPLPDGGTRWEITAEFHFHGLLKFLGPALRIATEQRTEADMARFKEQLEGIPPPDATARS
jgi:uncharacterized protein YndB with AHSA1/START domain